MTGTFDPSEDFDPLPGPSPADDLVEKYYDPALVDPPQEGWVRRAASRPKPHQCQPPRDEHWNAIGDYGDLWRCRCGELWRIVDPGLTPVPGDGWRTRPSGAMAWRPATLWQRIRYRKAMR